MGMYIVEIVGRRVLIQRVPGRGFRIMPRPGMTAPLYRRLYLAAEAAAGSLDPWPFTVEKEFDGALDMPEFLRRGK